MNIVNLLKSSTLKVLTVFLTFAFKSIDALCLTLAPGSSPPCGGIFGTCVPIDGGVSFLIAAGAAYGGKKAYDTWKGNQ